MNEYVKDIDIEFEITNLEPTEPKKMNFGKVIVCSKCGCHGIDDSCNDQTEEAKK